MKALPPHVAFGLSHRSPSREQRLVIAAAVAVAIFCVVAAVRIVAVRSFDLPILLAANVLAHRSRLLDHASQVFAYFNLFQGLALLALAYGAFAATPDGQAKVRLAIGVVGASAASMISRLVQLLMPDLSRPLFDPSLSFRRPYGGDPGWLRDWSSFPSDHATLLWGVAIATLMVNRRIGALALAVTFLTSLARVYRGLHYPTDILGGALLSAAVVCAGLACAAPFEERLLMAARRRPALVATVAFLFATQAASMFSEIRILAHVTARNVREIAASTDRL